MVTLTVMLGEGIGRDFGKTMCFDCGTDTTSLWRRDSLGNTVCNACRLYFLHHNKKRPLSARPHVIKRRNRKKQPKSKAKAQVEWAQVGCPQLPSFESLTQHNPTYPSYSSTRSPPTSDLAQYHYPARPSMSLPPLDLRSDTHDYTASQSSPPRHPTLPSLHECIRSLGVPSLSIPRYHPSLCPTTPPPSPHYL
ncbi:hypothetical protein DSO57_1031244 [Entomophthora muscae]|uniref:Uncharacterized protein n=1 Tax=Entomophthora muscae TaxID=34485 RepID=A0ACC2T0S4_9FUNG|nr:hypothetical protein DSO57_1031244 [Entomophthora muscae]